MILPHTATLWCITYFHGLLCPFMYHFNHKQFMFLLKVPPYYKVNLSFLHILLHFHVLFFLLRLIFNYFIDKSEGQIALTCIKLLSAATSFLLI